MTGAARLELEAGRVSVQPRFRASAPRGRPLHPCLCAGPARPSCLPSSRPGALCSPGGGVTPEPRGCLQHRSRSSLLRRMPVRGEYTMAPNLWTEAELGVGHGLPTHTGCAPALQKPLVLAAALQHPGTALPSLSLPPKIHPAPHHGILLVVRPVLILAQGHPISSLFGQRCQGVGPF